MKKFLLVLTALIIVCIYLVLYGFTFSFPPCSYTEKDVPLPRELQGTILRADKPAVYFEGEDGEGLACSKTLGTIERFISKSETSTSYKYYGAKEGGSIQDMQFTLKRIVKSTPHGISTIEGTTEIDWLMLEDEHGTRYRLATVKLGSDSKESFLGVWRNNQRQGSLIWSVDDYAIHIDTTVVK